MVPRAYTIIGATTAALLTAVLAASLNRDPILGQHPDATAIPIPSLPKGAGRPLRDQSQGGVAIPTTLVVVVTTALLVLYGLGLLIYLLMSRWRAVDEDSDRQFEDLNDTGSSEPWKTILSVDLHNAAEEQLALIHRGTPRNAIVACWMALQEASGGAGLSRISSETADEFTLRAIRGLDLDARAVSALATLYREARFSDHVMREHQRDQAGAALRVLAEQLGARSGAPDRRPLAESPQ